MKKLGILALWPVIASAAEEEPAWLTRAPEIRFEKRASHTESSLQQNFAGILGYSLAVRVTAEGRSEVSAGPLVRPMKGLEIGLERTRERAGSARNETSPLSDPPYPVGFDHRGTDARSKAPPVNLGSTGPFKYELHSSRLRVKYYIDEDTVLSVRARYNRVEQKATVWLWFERRF